MKQSERNVGAKNGLGFSKYLLACSKKSYTFAWGASLGLVVFCTVDPVPASTECSKAKSCFVNLEKLVVDA
jgi:hypothetical protein